MNDIIIPYYRTCIFVYALKSRSISFNLSLFYIENKPVIGNSFDVALYAKVVSPIPVRFIDFHNKIESGDIFPDI